MKSLCFFSGLLMILSIPTGSSLAEKLPAELGVVLTPRNFPKHTGSDVEDMFERARQVGSFAVIRVKWSEEKFFINAQNLLLLCDKWDVTPVLEFTAIEAKRNQSAELALPKKVSTEAGRTAGFDAPKVAEAFVEAVKQLAGLEPPYLALSTDVNLLGRRQPDEYAAFTALYKRAYKEVKRISPETRVYVTFQWDAMMSDGNSDRAAELIDAFRPELDVLALSSNPVDEFGKRGPSSIPAGYYNRIGRLKRSRERLLVQVSWPSKGRSGESEQVEFIQRLPELLGGTEPDILVWNFLHDVRILIFNVEAGLITRDGSEKRGFEAFTRLGGGARTEVAEEGREPDVPVIRQKPGVGVAPRGPATFGIYTAKLDGTDVRPLITDEDHEMTHGRVSPDGKRVTFTQYYNKGKDGKADEDSGYANTAIMLINIDGTGLEQVIPPKRGIIASNSSWSPDGRSLIFISTDNKRRSPQLMKIDLGTRKPTRVATPPELQTTDPHWEGHKIVFPAKGDNVDAIWCMEEDGSKARQITHPKVPKNAKKGPFNYGDFDPKLSPDGSRVAFMRFYGSTDWRIFVVDLESGEEKELTPRDSIEGLPEWSSDGKLLIFRYLNLKNLKKTGLYTRKPEGGERKMIPLPRGYLYKHSSFFPGTGSSKDARIIYSAIRNSDF